MSLYRIKPDWCMFGAPVGPNLVAIYASSTLSEVELEAVAMRPPAWAPPLSSGTASILLRGEMRSFVMATGATYADALRVLLEHWTPDAGPMALPPAVRALDSGPPASLR